MRKSKRSIYFEVGVWYNEKTRGALMSYGFGAWSRDGVIAHCPVG